MRIAGVTEWAVTQEEVMKDGPMTWDIVQGGIPMIMPMMAPMTEGQEETMTMMEDTVRTIFVVIRIEEDRMSPGDPMNIVETIPGRR